MGIINNQAPIGNPTALLVNGKVNTVYTVSVDTLLTGIKDSDGDKLNIINLFADNADVGFENNTFKFTPAKDYKGLVNLDYLITDNFGGALNVQQSFSITDGATPVIPVPVNPTTPTSPSGQNVSPTGNVSISGDFTVGKTLTVSNGTLADVNGLGALKYQWLRNGAPIQDATQNTYLLTDNDIGRLIKVKVSYIDGSGNSESVTSDATPTIAEIVVDTPIDEGVPEDIPQDPIFTLQVDKEKVDEGETVIFSLKTENLSEGTSVPFILGGTVTDNDVTGKFPSPKAFFVEADGTATIALALKKDQLTEGEEYITLSLADDETQNFKVKVSDTSLMPNKKPTGAINISGIVKEGQLLTATNTIRDADGLGDFKYQWFSNNSPIQDAIWQDYRVSVADVGKKITAQINYIDGGNNSEIVLSKPTAAVKAKSLQNGIVKSGTSNAEKIIGAAKDDNLSGLAGNDTLSGVAGNDILDGGQGNDFIDAGIGDDILIGGEGNDTLLASSGNDSMEGGDGNDRLVGDAGNDFLNGGLGDDFLDGGLGNDYYIIDSIKDVINETKTGGIDTVETTLINYTLAATLENLTLKGIQNSTGTGNASNNQIIGNIGDNVLNGDAGNDIIFGNAGNDTLDGGKGIDTLKGGNGNDTYLVNNLEDKIIEDVDSGEEDHILSMVSYDLGTTPNVEFLTLLDFKAINGIGNALNNLLQEKEDTNANNSFDGKSGNDTIFSQAGDDTLIGGEGDDFLDGGDGTDTAVFLGVYDDYQITRNPDAEGVDQIIVSYVGSDDSIADGTDTLDNIEILQFADGDTYNVRDIEIVGSIA